ITFRGFRALLFLNTFTNGDVVSGQVEVELAKDCQIESFYIKFKGKAEVRWTERHGQTTHVYHSKDKYFSLRHYFIKSKNSTGNYVCSTNTILQGMVWP
uniref:Ig-like domain-containing protein n=1 Tax=Cyprinodon variegatus TaxID=28743 RepID=A0A3Q2EIB2_CYPVA